jgi:hypothetical protein
MRSKSDAAQATQRASVDASAADAHAELPAFSRSTGLPPWMGKSTATVKTLVPDVVAEDLTRIARESGLSVSDFVRDMILVRLYGVDMVVTMRRRSLELAAGIGTERSVL